MREQVFEAECKVYHKSYRNLKQGPERGIVEALYDGYIELLKGGQPKTVTWVAHSPQVGAGMPDLLILQVGEEVGAVSEGWSTAHVRVIAYLKSVVKAVRDTIAKRTGLRAGVVSCVLVDLTEAGAVKQVASSLSLSQAWRNLIRHSVAIEAKVANWKSAISQAIRNTFFVHDSFVAFPERVAHRVAAFNEVECSGVGVIAVSENGALSVVRQPRHNRPCNPLYCYELVRLAGLSVNSQPAK